MEFFSRRSFLKSAALAGAGMALGSRRLAQAQDGITHWDGSPFGRVLLNVMTVYVEPDWHADAVGAYYYDDVVAIQGAVLGVGLYPNNPTWLQTAEGYIYSSWVQPVNDVSTNPEVPIGEGGAWGQVTVPILMSKSAPSDTANDREHIYYSQVGRIMALENGYYQVSEIYGGTYWLRASAVRIIPPEELAPISPDVPPADKRIEVSARHQRIYAYEGDTIVYDAHISSGLPSTPTPFGDFTIRDKRIGQRMTGGLTGGGYNLAGIPYISYFTRSWVALHGAYWHNNYGRRMSNGCVNMFPASAQWVFRWTTPVANYYAFNTRPDAAAGQPGTLVRVRW